MVALPKKFPFRQVFKGFLDEYSTCLTYWYVPKARTLNDENADAIRGILKTIFDEFLGVIWNRQVQDDLLKRLIVKNILDPYAKNGSLTDRTALTRIWKKLLETLGMLWVQADRELIITDAGLDVIAQEPRPTIENQIAKLQYPNPSVATSYGRHFKGILPHLFLLQVLQECDYRISIDEYELFVNLAMDQQDIDRITNYIKLWRDLNEEERKIVLEIVQDIPMYEGHEQLEMYLQMEASKAKRYRRIHLNSSYQRSLYSYPSYLKQEVANSQSYIICTAPDQIDKLVDEKLEGLKISHFRTLEDWFSYFGDPVQKPSWFTYLSLAVEKAPTIQEASQIVEKHRSHLTDGEQREIQRKQREKRIEDFYVDCLDEIEDGLALLENGRQFSTPIGRMDLLCMSENREYVVVEIKAEEADDSTFGQILRYIGWVHGNLDNGKGNVRGIIVAGRFPEAARYSRIGLLKKNYKKFLAFKRHGLALSDT